MTTSFSRRTMLMAAGAMLMPSRLFALASSAARPFSTLKLRTAEGRAVTVYAWRATGVRRGVIAFSHGALSSPLKYLPLIEPWVKDGYDVLAPLHVDSTDHPDTKTYTGFMSWRARIEDMRLLSRQIGSRPYIAAGHSYGGLVALTLGGAAAAVPEGLTGPLGDPHVKAVVAFSPPGPAKGLVDAAGYAALKVPALIQTGDIDVPPGGSDWHVHLSAYESAMSGGNRYALVLKGVDHYFGGLICRPELPGPHQQDQFNAALTLSELFLRGFGSGDRKARTELDARIGAGPQGVLSRK